MYLNGVILRVYDSLENNLFFYAEIYNKYKINKEIYKYEEIENK